MGRVEVQQRGRTLIARLDNPPHGLMDVGIVGDLDSLVERASNDDEIGAVVLTGTHPERFIAHYDVSELLAAARAGPSVAKGRARIASGHRRPAAHSGG